VRAVLAWGDDVLRAPRTVCLIDEGNAASVKVATKCGYEEYARTTFKDGTPTRLYER
jgi:RimJ/RimL family protein N-acetyltransferase